MASRPDNAEELYQIAHLLIKMQPVTLEERIALDSIAMSLECLALPMKGSHKKMELDLSGQSDKAAPMQP